MCAERSRVVLKTTITQLLFEGLTHNCSVAPFCCTVCALWTSGAVHAAQTVFYFVKTKFMSISSHSEYTYTVYMQCVNLTFRWWRKEVHLQMRTEPAATVGLSSVQLLTSIFIISLQNGLDLRSTYSFSGASDSIAWSSLAAELLFHHFPWFRAAYIDVLAMLV